MSNYENKYSSVTYSYQGDMGNLFLWEELTDCVVDRLLHNSVYRSSVKTSINCYYEYQDTLHKSYQYTA